jgi:hypothetical protein
VPRDRHSEVRYGVRYFHTRRHPGVWRETDHGRVGDAGLLCKDRSPLNIEHRILEVWDGETTTFVRGEAEMAKKAEPESKVTAPFMWLFRRAAADGRFSSWFITAGPLKTESVL